MKIVAVFVLMATMGITNVFANPVSVPDNEKEDELTDSELNMTYEKLITSLKMIDALVNNEVNELEAHHQERSEIFAISRNRRVGEKFTRKRKPAWGFGRR